MMSSEQVGGIVRALVSALGGYLVGQGFLDANTVVTLGGAAATIAAAIWSVYAKRNAA